MAVHESKVWRKRGFIDKPEHVSSWWVSHAMAPSAVALNDSVIRVFVGGWSDKGMSRVGFIDVDANDPSRVIQRSEKPVVDIGIPGTFDDSGVFPAHATKLRNRETRLYYTGFQHSTKQEVDHYNFNGLAISQDDIEYHKYSQTPVLDRSDEGLFIRAGLSVWETDNGFECVYSAGSGFHEYGGKLRPNYEVFYQHSKDGLEFEKKGAKIVAMDFETEHGLGRPQIVNISEHWYVFYTRRTLDMKYHIGCSHSADLKNWDRCDDWLSTIIHGGSGSFDDQMVYFPSVVQAGGRVYLFYCGNGYGREGFGYAELVNDDC